MKSKADKWNKKALKQVLKFYPNMVLYAHYKQKAKYYGQEDLVLIDPVKHPKLHRNDKS